LPVVTISARRKKPTSLTSKPGDLKVVFVLNRTRWPPILLNAKRPAVPLSDVRDESSANAVASGR
jgi:hypothetical protein